jgi:hypothetical protein
MTLSVHANQPTGAQSRSCVAFHYVVALRARAAPVGGLSIPTSRRRRCHCRWELPRRWWSVCSSQSGPASAACTSGQCPHTPPVSTGWTWMGAGVCDCSCACGWGPRIRVAQPPCCYTGICSRIQYIQRTACPAQHDR